MEVETKYPPECLHLAYVVVYAAIFSHDTSVDQNPSNVLFLLSDMQVADIANIVILCAFEVGVSDNIPSIVDNETSRMG